MGKETVPSFSAASWWWTSSASAMRNQSVRIRNMASERSFMARTSHEGYSPEKQSVNRMALSSQHSAFSIQPEYLHAAARRHLEQALSNRSSLDLIDVWRLNADC